MKNLLKLSEIILILFFITANCSYAVTASDYKTVIKSVKKMCKLTNQNKIDELKSFYSKDYKSFDGYNRDQIIEIFKIANKLYPDIKSKEKITKIETKDDNIKIYMEEFSKGKMFVAGEDARYAPTDTVKGKMTSSSSYSFLFKKENDKWLIISDEIYNEETAITYGDAINVDFKMEVPDSIKEGEEYTVKTTLQMPSDKVVVGSIGHDRIIFPPEKYFDPYRTVSDSGILERVMIANKEGKNEYANSTFAFISPFTMKKNAKEIEYRASISGMGIYVKRINLKKENVL